jgi:glycosyltransferase involved in cell wall biosynthesis
MLTLDILICSLNGRIARVPDLLLPQQERVRYVVSFQYTNDSYLTAIPQELKERPDVTLTYLRGEGLSANRNNALAHASSDLVLFIDDDTRILPNAIATVFRAFELHPETDIALFKAQTYAGKDLRTYPGDGESCSNFEAWLRVLTIEMVCLRAKVQGHLSFDARFGLGSHYLTCFEEQIWLEDARRSKLNVKYFAEPIVQTSAIYAPRLFYVESSVQRSLGGVLYYVYGWHAYWRSISFALTCARRRVAHFLPVLRHLYQGIAYVKKTRHK